MSFARNTSEKIINVLDAPLIFGTLGDRLSIPGTGPEISPTNLLPGHKDHELVPCSAAHYNMHISLLNTSLFIHQFTSSREIKWHVLATASEWQKALVPKGCGIGYRKRVIT